eukprot:891069-Rhodomonas_salina.1
MSLAVGSALCCSNATATCGHRTPYLIALLFPGKHVIIIAAHFSSMCATWPHHPTLFYVIQRTFMGRYGRVRAFDCGWGVGQIGSGPDLRCGSPVQRGVA